MGKGSFILYDTDLKSVKLLSENQAGRLFLGLATYRLDGISPDFNDDLALRVLYQQIDDHIKINEKKYDELCKRNSAFAKKRWQQSKTENYNSSMPMYADACAGMPTYANACLNDNDNVNDNDNDNVNVYDNDKDTVACGAKKKTKENNHYNKKNNIPKLLQDDPAYDIEAFERKAIGLKYQKKDNATI